jgi:Fe-S cluster biogenesis protein NfuA
MTRGELHIKVEEAIAQIRPFLEGDGGNIELIEVTPDKIVKVRLLGACSSCSMSAMTMKSGVEDAIRNVVPDIKEVIAIEGSLV